MPRHQFLPAACHGTCPAWFDQLAPGGTLVVPLRWRSQTRSVAVVRHDTPLRAENSQLCGFVPMIGIVPTGEKTGSITEHVTLHRDTDQNSIDRPRPSIRIARSKRRPKATATVTLDRTVTLPAPATASVSVCRRAGSGSVELSATIQKSATKIDSECAALNSAVRRPLDEALVALAGAHATGPELLSTADAHGAA
ncbi:hypothetical protein FHU38_000108 [Saccharomonospora amisosensis]|uniref:Uncharacterized protein n=1 Tax=Saccharomonospora amisosensis TaxID=1128677 RepID=A0A7X5UL50_9PSEU|nr:hypothetical protein [Saccharomonospora amisosensis]NIJ09764.1 hypothetical protein [Saccharomonospora amisosensis]